MLNKLIILSKNDFRSRYAGNSLGALWAFVYPLVTVLLYWFVFYVVLKTGPRGGVSYVLWLVSALVPYLFVTDALSSAASSLVDYSYLLRKSGLDVRLLPAARILACLPVHGIFLVLMLVLGIPLGIRCVGLLYYIAAELAFAAALGSLLSIVTVFFRDVRGILAVFVQIGFWITPIFWDLSGFSHPLAVIALDPVSYITEGFRGVMSGTASAGGVWGGVCFWSVTLFTAVLAKILFSRVKSGIVDYL